MNTKGGAHVARRTYTEEQKQEALTLYETHGPSHVEKALGIPKQTVQVWAYKAGVRTVRCSLTQEATAAAQVDNKLRRQKIIQRIYGQTEAILDDLESPQFRTIMKGAMGRDEEREVSFVPPGDRRTLVQALNTAMTTATNTEKIDADNGSGQVASMLENLIQGIGVPDE